METRLFNGESSIEAVLDTMKEKAAVTWSLTDAGPATTLAAAAAAAAVICSQFPRSSAVSPRGVLS